MPKTATGEFDDNPLKGLSDVTRRITELEKEQYAYVMLARSTGASWTTIGGILGVSKQAAHHKFTKKGKGKYQNGKQ